MIQQPLPVHTTTSHGTDGTPPELRKANEQALSDLARKAGLTWDKGQPLPTPKAPGSK
ncbi:MAG TPA: hypothetical protein VHR86_08795 [Armatimonadota bacterium]|nr:hypothetical protein [Armatimonadota bacterium]